MSRCSCRHVPDATMPPTSRGALAMSSASSRWQGAALTLALSLVLTGAAGLAPALSAVGFAAPRAQTTGTPAAASGIDIATPPPEATTAAPATVPPAATTAAENASAATPAAAGAGGTVNDLTPAAEPRL